MSQDDTNNITSPPYPLDNVTVKGMYRYLLQLRQWAAEQREELIDHPHVPHKYRDSIDVPAGLPQESVWEAVSVDDHAVTKHNTQGVRRGWDAILREHEDSWDGKLAVRKRYSMLTAALFVLREAFVCPEEREMRTEREQRDYHRQVKAVRAQLKRMATSADDDLTDDDAPESPDDWFAAGTDEE